MEQDLDDVFSKFNVKAKCISYSKFDSYQFYDCCLTTTGKIRDVQSIKNEIGLYLKLPNINIFVVPETSNIRIESFSKRPGLIKYESLSGRKANPTDCFLGKDYCNNTVSINIEDCPHLLIGGASGSGKSVLINTIIKNLIDTNVRLFLCDPKKIDFNKYNNENTNVFFDTKEIINVVEYLVEQMDNNYNIIKKHGSNFVPTTVLIIDEFGDVVLNDQSGKFKTLITKLAQKARAAKIHIVLSTQRPSASIVDGNIKANFPARISLKASSVYDSRIILDETGAENLFGKGDAIMKDSSNNFVRFQTAI